MLTGNNANSNTDYGIYIHSSSSNTLNGSNVANNYYGIFLESSSNNTVYDNFFNNTNNVQSSASVNKWNITKTAGTNIVGGPYIGGNVWAHPSGTGYSQTCNDVDGDGICDSSRTLDASNIDFLPLVYMPIPTPAFTTTDAAIALQIAVGSRPHDLRWDVSGDGSVTSLDALMILQAAA